MGGALVRNVIPKVVLGIRVYRFLGIVSHSLLGVIDDCLFDGQFKSKPFLRLSTQLRHYNITCIISTQYPQIIKPQFRNNCFQVAMFRTSTMNALQALFSSYGMEFETFNDFKKYLNDATNQKYNFVWVDKTVNGNDIKKKYQTSKCPSKIPNFLLEYNTKIE